jgi:hypothetical protein
MSDLIRGRKPLLALIAAAVAMAIPASAGAQNPGVDVYVEQVPTPSGTKATPKPAPRPAARPAPRNYTAPRPAAPAPVAPVQRYQAPSAAPAAPAKKKPARKHKHKHAAAAPAVKRTPAATAPVVPRRVTQPASASTGADFGPLALGLGLLGITAAVIGAAAVQRRRIARPAA